ncbi:hypothetical protein tb265_10350 [Gemmatimonadetes bacterium T265]|nr:hypothetical protein tb265_10350 [Gemmatimonadetes bacterium T265]
MVTHIDTNFLIRGFVIRSPEYVRLRGWVRDERALAIAAPAWAEFLCGPVAPDDVSKAVGIC